MKMTFKDLPLCQEVQEALDSIGFTHPTEIQEKAIPVLLEKEGVDIHGQAQTGTGKTLAFGIPLLHRIDLTNKATQGLVVAPTRELAVQICDSLKPFAKKMGITIKTIYGGVSMDEQIGALRRGVQLVVGTPGRINDHLRRKTMKIENIKTLVLDEADIMLDMGFKEEIDAILDYANVDREIWLFSATVKPGISMLMKRHMKDTVSIRVSSKKVGTSNTKQYCCVLPMRVRMNALCRFIESAPEFYGFIFCQTKLLTSEVADKLTRRGYHAGALHGDMSQGQRNAVIKKFKNKDYTIVVATDVAARGIDIQDLTHVVNYSLPEDHESYVHRTGRTGRAGKEGVAITFVSRNETRFIKMIQRKFSITIDPIEIPSRDDIIKGRVVKASEYLEKMADSKKDESVHKSVAELIHKFDEDQLRSMMMNVVQDKYLESILKEEDIVSGSGSFSGPLKGIQEISLAVGSDDGLDRESIIELLQSNAALEEGAIQKIRVIRRRTFIEVPADRAAGIVDSLRRTSLAGRRVRPEFVEEDRQVRRRSGAGGRRRDGSERFGRRGGFSGRSGSGRSGRSSSAYQGRR